MTKELAGIQYMGEAGNTQECKNAILRLLQFGDRVTNIKILSNSNRHSFLLLLNETDSVAVKSGFSSGYYGEGSRAFSYVLQLFCFHGFSIKEYEVSLELFDRLDSSALNLDDISVLANLPEVRPIRWIDFIFERDWHLKAKGKMWQDFPLTIPYAIIDHRITDLALTFWDDPDDKLMKGYRRLEEVVRERCGINESGTKLFSQAFKDYLTWDIVDGGEKNGRIQLFVSVYLAYRNPRAHRELEADSRKQLNELLLLNHLLSLEADSYKIELNS